MSLGPTPDAGQRPGSVKQTEKSVPVAKMPSKAEGIPTKGITGGSAEDDRLFDIFEEIPIGGQKKKKKTAEKKTSELEILKYEVADLKQIVHVLMQMMQAMVQPKTAADAETGTAAERNAMKIYNRVVIDIDSGEILEEDSFEYSGPLALAYKGGGADAGSDSDRGESGNHDADGSSSDSGGSEGSGNGVDASEGNPGRGDTSGFGYGDYGGGISSEGAAGSLSGSFEGSDQSEGPPGRGDTAGLGGYAGDYGESSAAGTAGSAFSTAGMLATAIGIVTANPALATAGVVSGLIGSVTSFADKYGEDISNALTGKGNLSDVSGMVASLGKIAAGLGTLAVNSSLALGGTLTGLAGKIAGYAGDYGQQISDAFSSASGHTLSSASSANNIGAVSGEAGSNGSENTAAVTAGMPGSADSARDATSDSAMQELLKAMGEYTLPSINDQFYGLFQGTGAPYGLADQMGGYTGVQEQTVNDWDAFETKYNDAGQSVLDAYDTLAQAHMGALTSIPQANLILPQSMGGATMPLAPGKWVNTLNAAADAQKDILNSKASAIPSLASVQASAIAGRNQAGSNQYLTPLNLGFDIFQADKGYANQQTSLDKQLDANEPSTWDKVLSGVMAGSKIYADNSEAINSGASSLWDWITGS